MTTSAYKVTSYTEQKLDVSLKPYGRKMTRYAVYKKVFPFPNKSICLWETVKSGFRTQAEAENYLNTIKNGI